ncbi:MAG: hypothetical protein IPM86_16490 [Saprospiraceae bacterium]|nr:hypothetical protein [Saprospiraceae bacterium]
MQNYLRKAVVPFNLRTKYAEPESSCIFKSVKQIIKTEKESKAKLEREIFSDADIQKGGYLLSLFQYENS